MVIFVGSFELKYSVKFVNTRIKDIMDDDLSSEYLQSQTRVAYLCHILFDRLFLKKNELFRFHERSSTKGRTMKSLGVSHLD